MLFTYVVTALIVTASLIVQGHTSFDVIRIGGVKPDLLFIAIIYVSYSFGSFYGQTVGFISGLFHDAVSNSPLGLLAFPKMVLGFLAGMFGRGVIKENILTVSLLLFAASLLKGVITLFLSYLFHHASISMVLDIIIPESFYNALLAPPLFVIFDKIFEKELEREGRF
jgi:rod shape-determining protein MreD